MVKRLASDDATALIAAVPQAAEAAAISAAPNARRASGTRKARAGSEAAPQEASVGRDVVVAAISELSACRALLAGETLRAKAPAGASAASGRR